jgi:hypothetical protein
MTVSASATGCGNHPTAPGNPQAGYTLSGTVTEIDAGTLIPVQDAVVTHVPTGRSAATDSSGQYVIPDVPARQATVTVMKDGYEIATRSVNVSGDTRLDLQLVRRPEPRPGPTLSGVVYESSGAGDVPVAGALVEDGYTHRASIADATGHYRLVFSAGELGMTDGFVRIQVSKQGFDPVVRELVPEGDVRLDIELVRR